MLRETIYEDTTEKTKHDPEISGLSVRTSKQSSSVINCSLWWKLSMYSTTLNKIIDLLATFLKSILQLPDRSTLLAQANLSYHCTRNQRHRRLWLCDYVSPPKVVTDNCCVNYNMAEAWKSEKPPTSWLPFSLLKLGTPTILVSSLSSLLKWMHVSGSVESGRLINYIL